MLEQMTQRLQSQRSFEAAVETVLNDVVALHGAEYGDLQLVDGDRLVIVAQRGLSSAFLQTFKAVTKDAGCACGRAWRLKRTVVVADVDMDRDYAPFRTDARAAGYRAVQSTPLMTRGKVMGMISTLFANPHEPTPIELEILGRYVEVAAEYLLTLLGSENLGRKAQTMNRALCADMVG
jgi:GAF domain-containing protein